MTCVVNPELPPQLEQLEADLTRKLSLSNVDDMNAEQELHTLHSHKSSFHASTTSTLHGPKLIANDSGTDNDTDNDEHAADLPGSLLTNSQRKQAQNAVFENYLRDKDESQLRQSMQRAEMTIHSIDDINQPAAAQGRKIIDRVRDYQSELFARAKAGNIIAVLDTGSGKTLIAALLLRETVSKEMDDRAAGRSPRTSFFLVGHVYQLQTLWTDAEPHHRHPVLLLQSNNIKCFVKI